MLKKFIKSEELISDLESELNTYEDEMQDCGYVEIEYFTGFHARKGFDYDLNIRIYEDEDSEVENFHYFSAQDEDIEQSNRLINEVKELLISKEVKFEVTRKWRYTGMNWYIGP